MLELLRVNGCPMIVARASDVRNLYMYVVNEAVPTVLRRNSFMMNRGVHTPLAEGSEQSSSYGARGRIAGD